MELYVTSWCPVCRRAQNYLRRHGIPFKAYDIEKDPDAARRKREIDPRDGVPLAVINGRSILGFSATAYDRALGTSP